MVRFKNRYITIEVCSSEVPENKPLALKSYLFHEALMDKIQQLHGDFGIAAVRTGLLTKYCNENTRIAIIRCRHGPHKFVTSALPFLTKFGKLDVTLRTLHVGATLKHSFVFIQKHQRSYLDLMWSKLKTDDERKALEAAVLDFTKTDVSLNKEGLLKL
ncbi:ribonuclease P/MRP protein subunit POP5 isoform X1 [Leptidea sinapis]|uniref:ribonuclease P/MRP protein subunit POP5 isoform X1 n=2 Tax=Leptidea sinapis TaxID=189913 RepID=UPI002141FFFB|nr:ribonuclease P/MRP protein subunit POP5 isoform X1 [Leptidea sinapis]XP_050678531.1 ribonuclease P/MRP protein subunit POP5 isoform X1 [Leptidea sinapis]XP_050678532.1 ribonuclease P/MRP protein subunit POP5 isoform X1 [Leptidea sinapis]